MDVMEKLVELLNNSFAEQYEKRGLLTAPHTATDLIAHGVTVQEDMKEIICRGIDNLYWRIYGANKDFNERMAGYNPSAFCAGYEYAIQLTKGLLTQLPQPPKGE